MSALYCTADRIGAVSGGGLVTYQEARALREWRPDEDVFMLGRGAPFADGAGPFDVDAAAAAEAEALIQNGGGLRLAHFYAGTFTETVRRLRHHGVRVTYTAAAHDRERSAEEFGLLGQPYPFAHMRDGAEWERYVGGYREADLVICPSEHSADLMRRYGCGEVVVIPHGVDVPAEPLPLPEHFAVGYLGQVGPDKGLVYLLRAWRRLRLPEAPLIMAGRGTEGLAGLWREDGGGNVELRGFVDSPDDLYGDVSVYVQPSVTEGFGIEVLEAMAQGRPVIAAEGAGAADAVVDGETGFVVPIRDPEAIAERLAWLAERPDDVRRMGEAGRERARQYSWDSVRQQYADAWRRVA